MFRTFQTAMAEIRNGISWENNSFCPIHVLRMSLLIPTRRRHLESGGQWILNKASSGRRFMSCSGSDSYRTSMTLIGCPEDDFGCVGELFTKILSLETIRIEALFQITSNLWAITTEILLTVESFDFLSDFKSYYTNK